MEKIKHKIKSLNLSELEIENVLRFVDFLEFEKIEIFNFIQDENSICFICQIGYLTLVKLYFNFDGTSELYITIKYDNVFEGTAKDILKILEYRTI